MITATVLLLKKYFFYLLFICFTHINLVSAAIITSDLTEDNYITYKNLDWAWASPVNGEYYDNILQPPEFHLGWRYASDDELNLLRDELTLNDFTGFDELGNSYIIQAVSFWNSHLTHVDIDNFIDKKINSKLTENLAVEWYYETVYVRNAAVGHLLNNDSLMSEPLNNGLLVSVSEPYMITVAVIALFSLMLWRYQVKGF